MSGIPVTEPPEGPGNVLDAVREDPRGGVQLIQRGVVRSREDTVAFYNSEQKMPIDPAILDVLKSWKQSTEFSAPDDWVFASPVRLGRLPWSYDEVLRSFQKAGENSGVGKFGAHTMRHTYRSWLDSAGTGRET